jgi:excisionase family DNA binding protein
MDTVFTTKEAADLLGVSLRTVQLWVESGVLKAWKTAGGHRRIAKESVDALLKEKGEALGNVSDEHPFRILVVEDDPDILRLYQLAIESWGLPVEIHTAVNGIEGLLRIGQFRPNVLISDLLMPNMDGVEMIRQLRRNPEYKTMIIVVITSLDPDEIKERGGLPGNVKLFSKPIPFEQIEAIVRENFGSRRHQPDKPALS